MRIGGLLILCGLLTAGLVQPDDPIPPVGLAGAPSRVLTQAEQATFLRGRLLFDKDFLRGDGVGPVFNGDSCRACHQDPVVGGSGGIDLQVQRPADPAGTGDLAQTHSVFGEPREEIPGDVAFVEVHRTVPMLPRARSNYISTRMKFASTNQLLHRGFVNQTSRNRLN